MNSFSFFPKLLLPAGLICACAHLSGAPLLHYHFDSNETVHDPNVVDENISAGDFSGGGGFDMPDTTSAVAQSGRSLFSSNDGFFSTDEGGAIDLGRFFLFTVEIDPGFHADFSSLSFYTSRREQDNEGIGAPQAFSIYSSADDFDSQIAEDTIPLRDDNEFTFHEIDLSSVAALQGVEGEVTFRIPLWNPEGIGSPDERRWRFDELTLEGSVIPEPGSVALMAGLLCLGWVFVSRKNRAG